MNPNSEYNMRVNMRLPYAHGNGGYILYKLIFHDGQTILRVSMQPDASLHVKAIIFRDRETCMR